MRICLFSISMLICFVPFAQQADTLQAIDSLPTVHTLGDITITANRLNQRSAVSEIVLDKQTIKTNHGLLEDPLRVVSTMPGVARGGDLFSPSQIYVRGGAPEENLFLNNNSKIYFPYYFGGQKSVFNSDVIENVELLTGGFPAKYGNALSSVLNVTTRDGRRDGFGGLFTFGFYNSSLLAEGPAGKNASFLVAARRTYLDLVMDETAEFPVPEFGDITYKLTFFADGKNKIMFSGLSGYEKLDFLAPHPEPGLPDRIKTGGNSHNQSLQWQHAGDKLFSKLSLVNTIQSTGATVSRNIDLDIDGTETGLREDAEYRLSDKIRLQAGFEGYYNSIDFNSTLPLDPRNADPTDTTVPLTKIVINEDGIFGGAWLSARLALTQSFGLNAGLRYDMTDNDIPATLAPRLSVYYALGGATELRVAYTHNYQFPASEAASSANITAPLCIHYIAGVQHKFTGRLMGWIEAYHKEYSRLVTYDTALKYGNNGSGYAQGIEMFLRKESGQFTGWVSYAYSVAKRKSNLDEAEYYFDFDQRHIANLSLQYKIRRPAKQWYIPALLNTQVRAESGKPYTPVLSAVQTPAGWQQVKGEINSLRDPYYLNVNFRIEWHIAMKKRVNIVSFFDIWNMLNRKNLLGRTYQYGNEYPDNVYVNRYYATPILPAGGVRIEFK